ncbi:MAG TPA: helix-turn-helix domain-containing protein [Kribbella sp.]|uniref:winged helix-turn-helix transcriptional regulator n=1 Tax=Kribbella sp. TaxID=1871183 RepID=UPI002D787540|nr:helix-turn-helix domain-containing protein [Kribbella sp.]HET6293627.1 helix-turn-helix domain-containing protein [Kribbella sp.]
MGVTEMATDDPEQLPDICTSLTADGELVRELLDRIGDKWSVLIVASLRHGPLRFTAIQHATGGISQRMLTLNLRHLHRDGLITRTSYPEVPPRVEYELTELGCSLLTPVLALARWAGDNAPQVRTHRTAFDRAD